MASEPSPFQSTLGGGSGSGAAASSGPAVVWNLTANHTGVHKQLDATIQLLDKAKSRVETLTAAFQQLQRVGQQATQTISLMAQKLSMLGGGTGALTGRGLLALPSASRGLPATLSGSTLVLPASQSVSPSPSAATGPPPGIYGAGWFARGLPSGRSSTLVTPTSQSMGHPYIDAQGWEITPGGGGGGGGGGGAGGGFTGGAFGGALGGGGGGGGSWWNTMPSRSTLLKSALAGMGAGATVAAASGLNNVMTNSQTQGIPLDLAIRQMMQQSGMTGNYNPTTVAHMMRSVHQAMGNFSYGAQDQASAISMLINSDLMRGGNSRQSMGNTLNLARLVGQLSASNPSLGAAGSAQALLSLTDPTLVNRLGSVGVGIEKPGGALNTNLTSIFHQLLESVATGTGQGTASNARLTNLARNGVLGPGGAGYVGLTGLGVSPEIVSALRQWAAAGMPNMAKVASDQNYANKYGYYSLATSQEKVAGSRGYRQGEITEATSGFTESVNAAKVKFNDAVGNLTAFNKVTLAGTGLLLGAAHAAADVEHAFKHLFEFLGGGAAIGAGAAAVREAGGGGAVGGSGRGGGGGGGTPQGGGGGSCACGNAAASCCCCGCGAGTGGGIGRRVVSHMKQGGGSSFGGIIKNIMEQGALGFLFKNLFGKGMNIPGDAPGSAGDLGGLGEDVAAVGGAAGTRGSFLNVPLVRPQGGGPTGGGLTGAEIVAKASQYLGVPYSWGGGHGNGPTTGRGYPADTVVGFDCSGLVQTVMDQLGVPFPRTTYTQVKMGTPVASLGQAQPGDLVFFAGSDGTMTNPGHVGIYVGNGQMIDAFETGTNVRVEPVSDAGPVAAIRRIASGGAGVAVSGTTVAGATSSSGSSATPLAVTMPGFYGDQNASVNTVSLIAQLLGSAAPTTVSWGSATGSNQGPQPEGAPSTSSSGGPVSAGAGATTVVGAVKSVTAMLSDPLRHEVALAMLMGSYLESNATANSPLNSGGAAGAWQIQLSAHPGVTAAQAENPGWAANFMFGSYMSGVQAVPASMWSSNPMMAGETAAYNAERPFAPYIQTQGPGRVQSAYQWASSQLSNYESGAWKIGHDQLAVIHAGEMVLPKEPAEALRRGAGASAGGGAVYHFDFRPGSIIIGSGTPKRMAEEMFTELERLVARKGLQRA